MSGLRRFNRDAPCPICGGFDAMPRGKGKRCHGFLSSDGRFAHCTREELAGPLLINPDSGTYAHRLDGPCDCGQMHQTDGYFASGPARSAGRGIDFSDCVHPYPADYRDEDGRVLFRVARWTDKDGSKRVRQFRPDGSGGWIPNRKGVRHVLYRLPETRAAIARGETIHVAEGEKCVEALRGIGLAATCNDGGAGKWRPEHTSGMAGTHLAAVWTDNDVPGTQHAEGTANALLSAGVPDVRRPTLAGLGRHGDIADWIAMRQRDTAAEDIRRELEEIVKQTPPLPPSPAAANIGRGGARTVRLSDVEPQPVDWLWPGYVPLGAVTVLDGLPGQGKSTLTLDLAARVSIGRAMPDGSPGPATAGVVILSAEDDLSRTIRPRLDAAGADCSRIATLAFEDDEGLEREPVLSPNDLARVEVAIRELNARLLIVDPLVAFMPDNVDTAVDADVRKVLRRLRDLAERTGCAVLVIRHPRKATTQSAILSGGGSIGIIGAARAGLMLAPDPDDESGRVLACPKANLGKEPPSLRLRIIENDGQPVISWRGPSLHNADSLLAAAAQAAERRSRQETESRRAEAKAEALDSAATALRSEVAAWYADGQPMRVREDAVPFLQESGLSRDEARAMIWEHAGRDWQLGGGGRRGNPRTLIPPGLEQPAGKGDSPEELHLERHSEALIPADGMNTDPPGTSESNLAPGLDLPARDSGGRADSGPPESQGPEATPAAGEITAGESGRLQRRARGNGEAPEMCSTCGGRLLHWSFGSVCTRCHRPPDQSPGGHSQAVS